MKPNAKNGINVEVQWIVVPLANGKYEAMIRLPLDSPEMDRILNRIAAPEHQDYAKYFRVVVFAGEHSAEITPQDYDESTNKAIWGIPDADGYWEDIIHWQRRVICGKA